MASTVHSPLRPWVLTLEYSDEPPFGDQESYDCDLRDPDGKVVDSLTFCGLTPGYVTSMANAHLPKHGLALVELRGSAIPDLTDRGLNGTPIRGFADHPEGIRWLQRPDQHEFLARCVAKRKNSELDFDAMPAPVLRDWLIDNNLEEYADFAYRLGNQYGKRQPTSIRLECRRWYSRANGWIHATSAEITDQAGRDVVNSGIRCGGGRYQMLATAASSIALMNWHLPELFPLQPDNACRQEGIQYDEFLFDVKRKTDL